MNEHKKVAEIVDRLTLDTWGQKEKEEITDDTEQNCRNKIKSGQVLGERMQKQKKADRMHLETTRKESRRQNMTEGGCP